MSVGRIGGLLLAALMALGTGQAAAQGYGAKGYQTNKWMIEGNIGGGWGDLTTYRLAGRPGARGDGDESSFAANVGVGYYFANNLFARLSYRYFGSFEAEGRFLGVPGNLDVGAHGLMLGLGFNYDLSRQLFLEATGEIGAAFLNGTGSVGGASITSHTETNFAGGLGLGLGFRMSPATDLLLMSNYNWLGGASAGSGASALTTKDLSVLTTTIGARIRF